MPPEHFYALLMTGRAPAPPIAPQMCPSHAKCWSRRCTQRDHIVPLRYRDGEWRQLVTVAGPDRNSGGKWEQAYARE